jgi:RHH-type rel operon transcriptional repressor/antitoxin RelB
MLAVQLPDDLDQRLDALAKATGRSKVSYVQEAVVEHLADLEDLYLAKRRLDDIRAGRARTLTLAEVEHDLGLEN